MTTALSHSGFIAEFGDIGGMFIWCKPYNMGLFASWLAENHLRGMAGEKFGKPGWIRFNAGSMEAGYELNNALNDLTEQEVPVVFAEKRHG